MKIDIINPEPKTAKEAFDRWREFKSAQATIAYGRKIEVIDQDAADFWSAIHGDSKADAEHARQEDEAIQDRL